MYLVILTEHQKSISQTELITKEKQKIIAQFGKFIP